jgi:hypothetical protein
MPALAHTLNVDAPVVTSAARQTRVVAELRLAVNGPATHSLKAVCPGSEWTRAAAARLSQICAEALTGALLH